MRYDELSTPALTIDLEVLERNLDRMAGSCRKQKVGLRPHTKTHKTPEVARMQLDRGAVGLTVAKVGEAEVMAEAGLDDILIAFPIFGDEKLRRLAGLARTRRIIVSLDSEATARALSRAASEQGSTVGVLVEFDVGFHRCGLEPGLSCLELARTIAGMPGLSFRGLMTYFGNIWGKPGRAPGGSPGCCREGRTGALGLSRSRPAGRNRLRRLDTFGRTCLPDTRSDRNSSRHLCLQ